MLVKFENHIDRYLSAVLYDESGKVSDKKRTTGWIGEPFNVDSKNEIEFEFISNQKTKKIKLHFEDDSSNSFGQIAELYIYTENMNQKSKRQIDFLFFDRLLMLSILKNFSQKGSSLIYKKRTFEGF